jgi:hypothetical protein
MSVKIGEKNDEMPPSGYTVFRPRVELATPQSPSPIIRGWYNRAVIVAAVPTKSHSRN